MPHFDGGGLADMLVDALPYVFVPVGNEAVCIDDAVIVVEPINPIGRHRFPVISAAPGRRLLHRFLHRYIPAVSE